MSVSLLLRLFLLFSEAFSRYLLQEGGGEEQEVFDRCAACETTPLYMSSLKAVSPGGVRGRTSVATRLHLLFWIEHWHTLEYYCGLRVFSRQRGRKEGREGERPKGRWTLWGWKSCQTQTCTDEDRRDQTAMGVWLGTASGESTSAKLLVFCQIIDESAFERFNSIMTAICAGVLLTLY